MAKQNNKADVDFIKALAELLQENDLTELEVKREYGEADRLNVRVSRQVQMIQAAPAAAPAPAPTVSPATAQATAGTPASEPQSSDPADLPGAVVSPMVGTAYLQPEPGADPFVSIGSTVAEGDTLLIVEAMKTMNHIPAPHAGTVKRILVADGDAVEFGAPLMIIE